MSNFFNMDNSLWRFLGRLADVMILNIVFLITCLPVVTIGAAWTSLSYVTLKMSRDEESYIAISRLSDRTSDRLPPSGELLLQLCLSSIWTSIL